MVHPLYFCPNTACRPFLLSNIPPGKLLLGMYPVLLFYTFLGTFIVYV